MTGDPLSAAPDPAPMAAPPSRRGRALGIVALIGFVLGIVAMYYLLPAIDRWRTPPEAAPQAATQPPAQPQHLAATAPIPVTLEGLATREAVLDAQLRAIEARMAAADAASRTAAGYARRAEGMMVAFAARRALDRGLQLGYIEGQLRDRFGAEQSAAVATIVAAARNPVTLADLREGLSRIAPTLTTGSSQGGFVASAWREVSGLVILRRDTTPSPRPNDRLQRARQILDAGNVEGALAEVGRMPGAADATSWIEAAKRHIEARRALNALELAAISGRSDPVPAPLSAPVEPDPAGERPAT
ncbi:hypothetical protein [Sphingomonas sp.]|uniref:hypothetical protein n=1 Tax=Sphingomonas sp. TaxID=28214 RepID=UPI002DD624B7|nr:hypothetical protein [Sphingomonas sp.]